MEGDRQTALSTSGYATVIPITIITARVKERKVSARKNARKRGKGMMVCHLEEFLPHVCNSAHDLASEAGCVSDPESLSQIDHVKPNLAAAALWIADSSSQLLPSALDDLSHVVWVYPNTPAAACSFVQSSANASVSD